MEWAVNEKEGREQKKYNDISFYSGINVRKEKRSIALINTLYARGHSIFKASSMLSLSPVLRPIVKAYDQDSIALGGNVRDIYFEDLSFSYFLMHC